MNPPKKNLTDITLNEVSFVDAGANPGAHLMFWKRKPDMTKPITFMAKVAKLFATAFPTPEIAKQQLADLAKEDDAKSFDQVVGMSEVWTAIWQATDALNTSIRSILDSDEAEKQPLLNRSLDEFKQHLLDVVSSSATKTPDVEKEAGEMSEDLKKSLGLADTATDADVASAVAKVQADLAKAQADAAFAKMSEPHREYVVAKGLKDDDLTAFVAKSDADREAVIKTEPIAKSASDVEIEKRDRELSDLKKSMADLQKRDAVSAIAKRAETEMSAVAKADDLADLIYDVTKHDASLGERLENVLKTANARIEKGGLLKELGSGHRGISKGADAIEAAAKELQKSNTGWSIQKARTEARKQNPELAAQERTESRQAA